MSVLILSTAANQHANAIQNALGSNGIDFLRFNFDPEINNSIGLSSENNGPVFINGRLIQPEEVSGIFLHHPFPQHLKYQGSDLLDSSLRAAGWRNALDWFEETFKNAIWINKPSHSRGSASILSQLNTASAQGMRVPRTLLTNDIELMRTFAVKNKKIILKCGALPGVNLEGYRLLTHLVNSSEITTQELEPSPCLFQEYIEKKFELRIHVIGDQIHACKIESQKSSHTQIDWRNYRISETPHFPFEVEESLAYACIAITKKLGLTVGILDIIITPEGEAVFLECNSQGHWLWIEELTKMPITQSIAKLLSKNN
jgi:glutathione synthase/RimK-type ligase-like ATP-grasp enzyme